MGCFRLLTSIARNIFCCLLCSTCSSNESEKEKLHALCHAGQHWALTQLVSCILSPLITFLSRPFSVRVALQTVHICYISPEHCVCTKFKTEHFNSILLKITLPKYNYLESQLSRLLFSAHTANVLVFLFSMDCFLFNFCFVFFPTWKKNIIYAVLQ